MNTSHQNGYTNWRRCVLSLINRNGRNTLEIVRTAVFGTSNSSKTRSKPLAKRVTSPPPVNRVDEYISKTQTLDGKIKRRHDLRCEYGKTYNRRPAGI